MKKFGIIAGLILAASASYASDFSYTNEIKANVEENYRADGRQKNEWTIGKGYYKINETLRFIYDVDRDFISYNNEKRNDLGWDANVAIEKTLDKKEILGKNFSNKITFDYYWDKSEVRKETELGLAFKTSTKLTESISLSANLWGRHIKRTASSTDGSDKVFGLEVYYGQKFNKDWSLSASLKGYEGGYTDGGATFRSEKKDGKYRDGFNYEGGISLNNLTSFYKNEKLNLGIKTTFASYWYALGNDYDNTSSQYNKSYIRTAIVGKYVLSEDVNMWTEVGYNIFGKYNFSDDITRVNGTKSKIRDANEFEALAGITIKL